MAETHAKVERLNEQLQDHAGSMAGRLQQLEQRLAAARTENERLENQLGARGQFE